MFDIYCMQMGGNNELPAHTKYKHGMKNPVKDHRMSLYQSYRTTQEPVDFW